MHVMKIPDTRGIAELPVMDRLEIQTIFATWAVQERCLEMALYRRWVEYFAHGGEDWPRIAAAGGRQLQDPIGLSALDFKRLDSAMRRAAKFDRWRFERMRMQAHEYAGRYSDIEPIFWVCTALAVFKWMPHKAYLQTDRWNNIRVKALYQHPKCTTCSNGFGLHVHHNDYSRKPFEAFDDLTVLCAGCHEKVHEIKKKSA